MPMLPMRCALDTEQLDVLASHIHDNHLLLLFLRHPFQDRPSVEQLLELVLLPPLRI